ncbi:hypothetical protein [Pedobacter sp. Leaf176]|uniref:hypothetical protein n=1 Tax=Pedobacter sp. Leaf176 TaxID=1736286 RepID=UPI000700D48B|nr:hypothetical protein [Pedobacter sp. Leaf176]KQR69884.1 hypothetical protein ASF92_14390 [Pedobacter sp. Leaf176]
MESQVTNNANALRIFFTEDVFLVEDKSLEIAPDFALNAVSSKSDAPIDGVTEVLSVAEINQKNYNKPGEILKDDVSEGEISLVTEETVVPKSFKFLGGNKKSVLILVNDSDNEVSTLEGRELLRKIVKAIDLSAPDFALVNYANYQEVNFIELHQFFKPQLMLSFGVEPQHLKLDLAWSEEMIHHETTRIIFAPNLHPLDGDIAAKKSLWANLQKIK